jgi:non-specific serine/threonine protein kinase/serine/threonine-protein kinase
MESPANGGGDATTSASTGAIAGTMIGPYRLIRILGAGGMGEVWLAEQTSPVHRLVALKVIKPGMDSRQVLARFEAERQALALMVHPAIAAVFDGGVTAAGRPYFVMEYVQGEPITTYCDRHRLNVRERLALFDQVCDGVQHAHQKGVIHRDLKPSNVLVTIIDDHAAAKIIDFGVAKATAQPLTERTLFTELGVLIGTPEYMSPEQAEMGALDIDTRTDIYALGVILYELLTGFLPIDRAMLREAGLDGLRRLIREQEPTKPSTRITSAVPASGEAARNRHSEPGRLARVLRGDLDWIALKALEKDRTRRYGSASEFVADIRRFLNNEPVLAGPPGAMYRIRKFVRRHPTGLAASGGLLIVLIAFGLAMWIQARRVAAERDVAARERDRAEQVSAFLVSLFQASDPDRSKGAAITARDLLDRGVQRLQSELGDQPQTRATLLHAIGAAYGALGQNAAAQSALEQALSLRKTLTGPARADLADTINELGRVSGNRGDIARQEAMYREALQLRQEILGPEHVKIAQSLNNIGVVAFEHGQFSEAEQFFRRAVSMATRVGGPADVAGFEVSVAAALSRQYRNQEALDLMRDSTARLQQALGSEHTRTQMAMNNLGRQLFFAGKYAEAEAMQREVLSVRRKLLGPDHLDVAAALFVLGDTIGAAGRAAEAESVLGQSVAMQQRLLAKPTVTLAWTRHALAGVLLRQGKYDEAEGTYRAAVDTFTKADDSAREDRSFALEGLGHTFYARHKLAEAERAFREALAERKAANAVPFSLAWSQAPLGRVLCERGAPAEGIALVEAALKGRGADARPDDALVAETRVAMGTCLVAARRFDEAQTVLTSAYTVLAAQPESQALPARDAAGVLVALYTAWAKPQEAAAWRQKAPRR